MLFDLILALKLPNCFECKRNHVGSTAYQDSEAIMASVSILKQDMVQRMMMNNKKPVHYITYIINCAFIHQNHIVYITL